MASNIAKAQATPGSTLLARIASDGSAAHPYLRDEAVFGAGDATRNLADAVHHLCILHGRHPGLIDYAADATACGTSRRWLHAVAPAFACERLYVTRLAVAAGPVPSTPGSAESEAAVSGQRHALQMLARSERNGCSLGAAMALIADWHAIRPLLDRAALRFGIDPEPCGLPDAQAIELVIDDVAGADAMQRALGFGVEQVLVQHRGLLDLLDARQSARRDS